METLQQSKKTINFLFLNANSNKRIIILLVLSFFLTSRSFSQSVSKQIMPNVAIVQVDDYLGTLKALPQASNPLSPYNRLESLLRDVQPSVYFKNRVIKAYGKNPVCVYSDVSSFALLNSELPLNNDVEMITVKIESRSDLKTQLDICSISNLKKLKYLFLQVDFDSKPNELMQFIKNCKIDYVVIYKIEKGA